MILVTGTEHSGVSLWMQILSFAGFPTIDDTFRTGVYYATNPNPTTGEYLFPEQVEHHAVRVSASGLLRTDRAYVGRVLATVCHPADYVVATRQRRAIEDMASRAPAYRMPPFLSWWSENYALVRDIATRRHAAHVESYERLAREPERVIREVIAWLGSGDATEAVRRVRPEPRPARAGDAELPAEHREAFEALHSAIDSRSGLTAALVQKLNETHTALLPRIAEAEQLAKSSRLA